VCANILIAIRLLCCGSEQVNPLNTETEIDTVTEVNNEIKNSIKEKAKKYVVDDCDIVCNDFDLSGRVYLEIVCV
tara:strand:+ start:160 stop:384 length:225 start_codon:yes stop_codon:yes gene_type:complete